MRRIITALGLALAALIVNIGGASPAHAISSTLIDWAPRGVAGPLINDHLYIIDQANVPWPLLSAVNDWRARTGEQIYYNDGTGYDCKYVHCAFVHPQNMGANNERTGLLNPIQDSAGRLILTDIYINSYYSSGYERYEAWQAVGRAAGLLHTRGHDGIPNDGSAMSVCYCSTYINPNDLNYVRSLNFS